MTRTRKRAASPVGPTSVLTTSSEHRKAIAKLIEQLAHRHSTWNVFSDFVEMSAISISNSVDRAQRDGREQRYAEIVKRYKPDETVLFPQMFAELVSALEVGFDDVLGRLFHDLELHNKWTGQFFSPYALAQMLARVTLGQREEIDAALATKGFITALEPASGGGAMMIALAEVLKGEGINYQRALHVTAVDVDLKCVHMTYLQLALLGIPAVVVHGNSLTLEEHGRWYTPMHVIGGWTYRLRRDGTASTANTPSGPTLVEADATAEVTELQFKLGLEGAA
jgi:hypothetical protein